VSETEFQAKLDACNSEQERAALITETMNGLYDEAADKYKELNKDVIAANEAQDRINNAMAGAGAAMEPFVTVGKQLIVEVLEKLTPALEWLGTTALPWVSNAVSDVVKWFQDLLGKLGESGITFDSVMTWIQDAFGVAMQVIKDYWEAYGQPVWDFVKLAVKLVADYFKQRMPQIRDFVKTTFKDIQNLWNNNLKPAFKAIGDFITNVLAPTFKWVFENVITPVADAAFNGIGKLWTNSLKPIFEGMIDFIGGVFSGDFSKAWQGVVDAVGGVWEGIKTVIKTPINAAIGIINNFIGKINGVKIPDWVPGMGGTGILNIPKIPLLYDGGVLERGQTGFLEGTGAEAVVPLHNNKKWTNAVAKDMDGALGGGQTVALLQDLRDLMERMVNSGIYLDTGALVGGLAKPMDKKLGQIQAAKARG
jgi:hypothetical protein